MDEVRKIVNRRINKLRETLGLTQPEFAAKLGLEGKKGRSTINNWETGNIQVKSDDLILISKTFNVSTDWLLGRDQEPSEAEALATASAITGLNARSVELLHYLSQATSSEEKRTLAFLNLILSDPKHKKRMASEALPVVTIFSLMDQYVRSGQIKRSVPDDQALPKNLEEYEIREELRQFEQKTVTVESSEELTEVVEISKFYKPFKLEQIKAELDAYYEQEAK